MFAPIRPRPITPSCMSSSPQNTSCYRPSNASGERAIASDERIGRAVMLEVGRVCALQFRQDSYGQYLAQFHAPLVEGIDVPYRALGEDTVFVKRNELAECRRRQTAEKERVRGPVPFELAMRHQPVGRPFRLHLRGALAERQRLALREDIREQDVVMMAKRI